MLALPTLLIRFDIEKAGGAYGMACYERLFGALERDELNGTVLFDGDSSATLSGRENVNVIAVQCGDYSRLSALKDKLAADAAFMEYTDAKPFELLQSGSPEPLVLAGNYADGEFGGGGWPAAALKAVNERRAKAEAEKAAEPIEEAEKTDEEAVQPVLGTENIAEGASEPVLEAEKSAEQSAEQTIASAEEAATAAERAAEQAASPFAKAADGAPAQPAATNGETPPAGAGAQKSEKPPKAPADPAKAAKNKRTALLALAAALALGWCALLGAWLPGVVKPSPVKYSAEQVLATLPEAAIEACRRTGKSNEYIEALVESCTYPSLTDMETSLEIAHLSEEDKGKPYTLRITVQAPIIESLGDVSGASVEEFKAKLAWADRVEYKVDCLVDYDGIYMNPTQMKEIVYEGNLYLWDALDIELTQPETETANEAKEA